MGNDNILKSMTSFSTHITNLNKIFKNIKSEIVADFVHSDQYGLIITTNNITSSSNLSTIENYIKNVNNMKLNDIMIPHLSWSKSYLKIIVIPYLMENTNILINSSIFEAIIKNTHIFNNVILTSKPQVIKTLPKLDIVII